jgi:hypothetical protein
MLERGDVFLASTPGLGGATEHYHIVLKVLLESDIAVVFITSEVDKVKFRCRRDEKIKFDHIEPTTAILINKTIYSKLKIESAINANLVQIKPSEYYESLADFKRAGKLTDMKIIGKIIKAAKSSNTLEDKIKNLL